MLAQIADLFDDTTWKLIFAFGLAGPAVAFLIGFARRGRLYAAAKINVLVYYYVLMVILFIAGMAVVPLICGFYVLLTAGALGVVFYMTLPFRKPPENSDG